MSNYCYRFIIAYDGSSFSGWQDQAHGKTVQGELKRSIAQVLKSKDFAFFGASRTDKGVHARKQVAVLRLHKRIDSLKLLRKLNSSLSPNIFIQSLEEVSEDFNPLENKTKTYKYYFTDDIFEPSLNRAILFCEKLNIDLLRQGLDELIGTHSFHNFTSAEYSNYQRTIFTSELTIEKVFEKDVYALKLTGDGFLKYMVRAIVGFLIELGQGKLSLFEFKKLLSQERAERKLSIASSCGLYLEEITY